MATFNFTNSMVGAGAMGLGGAIAASGGFISLISIIFLAVLSKVSLDMLVELTTIFCAKGMNTYEDLGQVAFGNWGRTSVLVLKAMYAFGCKVAYIVVVRDNLADGLEHLIFPGGSSRWLSENHVLITFLLCTFIVLPMCFLREMQSLATVSLCSVASMMMIVCIIVYLFIFSTDESHSFDSRDVYDNWIEVRYGFLESLGTFVFTFVSQHTVHLAFNSIKTKDRNLKNWKLVSLFSISMACFVSLTIGFVVYMTFGKETRSDIFEMYSPSRAISMAKVFLSLNMLLTCPLVFLTCREMVIVLLKMIWMKRETCNDLQEALIPMDERKRVLSASLEEDEHSLIEVKRNLIWPCLLPGSDKNLRLPYHAFLTILLWSLITAAALLSPSLGDVLDLVGSFSGTGIAFILPGLFSIKLRGGYSHKAAFVTIVGGAIGLVGTYFSTKKFLNDL